MTPRFPIPPIEDDFLALRWEGITRPYGPETVSKLRGSVRIEHTLAQLGEAADAVQRLADFLERNPNALISGKKRP